MIQTGLVTKDIVLNTSSKESMGYNTYSRLVGGNLTDRALSNVKKLFLKITKIMSSHGSGVRSGGSTYSKNQNLDIFC